MKFFKKLFGRSKKEEIEVEIVETKNGTEEVVEVASEEVAPVVDAADLEAKA